MSFEEYTSKMYDLSNIAQRGEIISRSLPDIARQSSNYIESSENSDSINLALNFIATDLLDMARSDLDVLMKIGWFPWVEISNELSEAFSLMLMGFHKSAIDCQRRALELSVVASYLSLESISQEIAKEWIHSKIDTPSFSRAIKELSKNGFPCAVNNVCNWANKIKEYYWELCDSVHTKGEKYSGRKINSYAGSYNGIAIYKFDESQLDVSCKRFTSSVGEIAFICAIANPISLFGLPIEEKFGINPPASGYLQEYQSERLRKIIPMELSSHIIRCAEMDEGCKTTIDWIMSLPDISAEEFNMQCSEFNHRTGLTKGESL